VLPGNCDDARCCNRLRKSAADSDRTDEMMLCLVVVECVVEIAVMAWEAIAVGVMMRGKICW
jgi:hypothetical protein